MALYSSYLFNRLSKSQLERLKAISYEKKIQKGRWLFREGRQADYFYLIKKGAIELLTVVDEHIEIPIAMVRPKNGCVGVGALVPPHIYSLSARASIESTLMAFGRTDLEKLSHDDPDLFCIIMTNLAQKLMERLKETRQELKIHFMNLVRSATF